MERILDKESKKIIKEAVIAALGIGAVTNAWMAVPILGGFVTPIWIYWGGLSSNWVTLASRLLYKYKCSVDMNLIIKLVNTVLQGILAFIIGQGVFNSVTSVIPGVGIFPSPAFFGVVGLNCFVAGYTTYVFGESCDEIFSKKNFDIQDVGILAKKIVKSMKGRISFEHMSKFKKDFIDKNPE